MHLEQADFFINKKIPIMVEKPLTEDFDKSMELINNAKDAKVLLKCGFTIEGKRRRHVIYEKKRIDTLIFGILKK